METDDGSSNGPSSLSHAIYILKTPSSSFNDRLDSLRYLQLYVQNNRNIQDSAKRSIKQLVLENVLRIVVNEEHTPDLRKREMVRTECFLMLSGLLDSNTLYGDAVQKMQNSVDAANEEEEYLNPDSKDLNTNNFNKSPTRNAVSSETKLKMNSPVRVTTSANGNNNPPSQISQYGDEGSILSPGTKPRPNIRPPGGFVASPAKKINLSNSMTSLPTNLNNLHRDDEENQVSNSLNLSKTTTGVNGKTLLKDIKKLKIKNKMLQTDKSKVNFDNLSVLKEALMKGAYAKASASNKMLKPRPSTIMNDVMDEDNFAIKIPGQDPTNTILNDRKLGYSKSKVWFPSIPLGLGNSLVPQDRAFQTTTDAVVDEYLQMQALMSYVGDLVMPFKHPKGGLEGLASSTMGGVSKRTKGRLDNKRFNLAVKEAVKLWTPLMGSSLPAWAKRTKATTSLNKGSQKRLEAEEVIEEDENDHDGDSLNSLLSSVKLADGDHNIENIERSVVITKGVLRKLLNKEISLDNQSSTTMRDSLNNLVNNGNIDHKKVTSLYNEIDNTYEESKKNLVESQKTITRLMHETIQLQYSSLPPRYLVVVDGKSSNLRTKFVTMLTIFAQKKRKNLLSLAIGIWKICLVSAAFESRKLLYKHYAGCQLISQWVKHRKFRQVRKWTLRWKRSVILLIFEERHNAVLPIQVLYRQWRDRNIFKRMHSVAPYNGPLTDMLLEPFRDGLQFFIPKYIRAHRRMFWFASVKIQAQWRCLVVWRVFIKIRRQVLLIQSCIRMFPKREQFKRLKLWVIKAQANARRVIARNRYTIRKRKAIVIQKYIRRCIRIMLKWRLFKIIRTPKEKQMRAVIKIQSRWRIIEAIRRSARIVEYHRKKLWATLMVQRNYYRTKNAYHTFVLMSAYRAREKEDKYYEDLATSMGRYKASRLLQRFYRIRYFKRINGSCTKLQCWYRGRNGYNYVQVIRKRCWAQRKLHHWARGWMKKKHSKARLIQKWWWYNKSGRLKRHIEDKLKKKDLANDERRHERKYLAASRIIGHMKGINTRYWVRREKAARKIQKVARLFLIIVMMKRCEERTRKKLTLSVINQVFHIALTQVTLLICRQHSEKFAIVQALVRGFVVRSIFYRARSYAFKYGLAVVTVQRFWKRAGSLVKAVEEVMARKRMDNNPFKSSETTHELLMNSRKITNKYYHPNDPRQGLRLSGLLYRMGQLDMLPMFPRKDFLYVNDLRVCTMNSLVQLFNKWQVKIEKDLQEKILAGKATQDKKKKEAPVIPVEFFKEVLYLVRPLPVPFLAHEKITLSSIAVVQEALVPFDLGESIKKQFNKTFGTKLVARCNNLARKICEESWSQFNNYKSVVNIITKKQILSSIINSPDSGAISKKLIEICSLNQQEKFKDDNDWDADRVRQCAEFLQLTMDKALVLVPEGCIRDMITNTSVRLSSFKRKFTYAMNKPPEEKKEVEEIKSPKVVARKNSISKPNGKKSKKVEEDEWSMSSKVKNNIMSAAESLNLPLGDKSMSEIEYNVCVCKIFMETFDKLHTVTTGVQRLKNHWHYSAIRRALNKEKLNNFLVRVNNEYQFDRHADHVSMYWKKQRKKHLIATKTSQIIQTVKDKKQAIIDWLAGIIRYNWVQMVNDADEVYYMNRESLISQYEFPAYEYEQYLGAMVMVKHTQMLVERLRERKRAKEEAKLKEIADAQAKFEFEARLSVKTAHCALKTIVVDLDKSIADGIPSRHVEDGTEGLYPWKYRLYNVDILYNGMWCLLKEQVKDEEISIIDPKPPSYEVVRIFHIHGNRNHLCNARNIKNNIVKNVNMSRLFSINYAKGSKVEARAARQLYFYRGTIIDVIIDASGLESYTVKFDDGEIEKNMDKVVIRPATIELKELFNYRRKMTDSLIAQQKRVAHFLNLRDERLKKNHSELIKSSLDFANTWISIDEIKKNENEKKKNDSYLRPVVGSVMKKLLAKSGDLTCKEAKVKFSITYTRRPLRHGWSVVRFGGDSDKFYYYHEVTEEKTEDPKIVMYTPTELYSAKRLQSIFRCKTSKKRFKDFLNSETIESIVKRCLADYQKKAYIGYKYEGVTTPMKLLRLGCWDIANVIVEWHNRYNKKIIVTVEDIAVIEKADFPNIGIIEHQHIRLLLDFQNWWRRNSDESREKALTFYNHYNDQYDTRSIDQCSFDSYKYLEGRFIREYPSGLSKTKQAVRRICEVNHFPLTYGQIDAYLRRYRDKAEMARENVDELIDKASTQTCVEENEAFNILRVATRRIGNIIGNKGLKTLRKIWLAIEKKVDELYETINDQPQDKEADRRMGPGIEGKAALMLRIEAIDYITDVIKSTITIQRFVRGFVKYSIYMRRFRKKKVAIIDLQRWTRGISTREYAKTLRIEQEAEWEQMWDSKRDIMYFYNRTTQSSKYTAPVNEVFRPLVRDRLSARLIQSWPHLDIDRYGPEGYRPGSPPKSPTSTMNNDMTSFIPEPKIDLNQCMICSERKAVRICLECVGHDKTPYCFPCFSKTHADEEFSGHTFTDASEAKKIKLMCCVCDKQATRKCQGILDENQINNLCSQLQTSHPSAWNTILLNANVGGERKLQLMLENLRGVTDEHHNHTLTPGQLQQVRTMLERTRAECDELYCKECYVEMHSGGKRANHKWKGFSKSTLVCSVCIKSPGEVTCRDCDNSIYCKSCFNVFHSMGKKKKHKNSVILESLDFEDQVYCSLCNRRGVTVVCNFGCGFNGCDSCYNCEHVYTCEMKDPAPDVYITCVACGEPANKRCKECGDAYCSKQWMGFPGCFPQFHANGRRLQHSTVSIPLLERVLIPSAANLNDDDDEENKDKQKKHHHHI
jgi:hypothetical protein